VTAPLVTVGIPIYKRLETLPRALASVAAQDHPSIELIVSDNGANGQVLDDIIRASYPRPFRVRRNDATVPVCAHYNQIIAAATGTYLVLLDDDDAISPTFVSDLVAILEERPDVAVGIGRQDIVETDGRLVGRSSPDIPPFMSGEELIRSWTATRIENFSTMMARTADVRYCGGYPDFPHGAQSENALIVKLCLGRTVAYSPTATYCYYVSRTSYGLSSGWKSLAEDTRQFLRFLDDDPVLQAYASDNPDTWPSLKDWLATLAWASYYQRWNGPYRQNLSIVQWTRAACAMPFIPHYYREVASTLMRAVVRSVAVFFA
jgi:glycosyltransferase involved in cell wall biosynthesis